MKYFLKQDSHENFWPGERWVRKSEVKVLAEIEKSNVFPSLSRH